LLSQVLQTTGGYWFGSSAISIEFSGTVLGFHFSLKQDTRIFHDKHLADGFEELDSYF